MEYAFNPEILAMAILSVGGLVAFIAAAYIIYYTVWISWEIMKGMAPVMVGVIAVAVVATAVFLPTEWAAAIDVIKSWYSLTVVTVPL